MSHQEVSCGLEYIVAPDLQGSLTEAFHANYSFIVTPVVHPRFRRHHIADGRRVGGFTRSDMILSPQDWTTRIVGRLSPYLNVDSPNDVVRQRHEDCMNEELSYSKGLGLPALLVTVQGKENHNLARNLLSYLENSHQPTLIWAQVPMQCSRTLRDTVARGLDDDEEAWDEPWLWWSKFHERLQWDKRVGVVLELSADLPSDEILKRWLGEPVKAVIVPTSIFQSNKKGYPVLSRAHQQVLISLVERDAQVVITGARRATIEHYRQYISRLWSRRPAPNQDPMMDYARGWEDYLQTPLQPLADNLDTHTYNVFEKDPIKYDQYQKAITQALAHLKKRREESGGEQSETKELTDVIGRLQLGQGDAQTDRQEPKDADAPFVIMVLGAGRGPLVRASLNAADIVQAKVKVIAVEKNPCAVVVLEAQARELWGSRDVSVVSGDMRRLQLANKADIIVSELLGKIAVEKNPCAVVVLEAQARELWGSRDVSVVSGDMRRLQLANKADIIVSELLGKIAVEKNPCAVVVLEAQARELWGSRDVSVVSGDMRRLQLANKADIIVSELLGKIAVEKNPCAVVVLEAQARELWGSRDVSLVSGDMRRLQLANKADIIVSELLGKIAVEKNPCAVVVLEAQARELWGSRDVSVVSGDMRRLQLANKADIIVSELLGKIAVEKNPCAVVVLEAQARELWGSRDVSVVSGDMRRLQLVNKADIIVSELLGKIAVEKNPCAVVVLEAQARELWGSRDVSVVSGDMRRLQLANKADIIVSELLGKIAVEKNPCAVVVLEAQARELWGSRDVSLVSGDMRRLQLANKADIIVSELLGKIAVEKNPCAVVVLEAQARELWGSRDVSVVSGDMRRLQLANKADIIVSELLGKIAVEKNPCAVVVLEAQARELWGSRDVSVVSGDMRRLQLANKADIIVSELLGKIAVEKNPCAVVVLEAQARELWGSRDVSVVSGDMRRLQLANKADIIVSELLGKIAVEKNPCAVVVLEAQARELWGSRDVSVVSGDMRRLQLANKADIIVSELLGKIAVEKNPCAVVVLEAQARELWGSRDVSVVSGDMRRLQLANKADIIVSELLGKIAVEKNPCAVVVLEAQARELWGSRNVSVVSGDMRRLQLANKADIIVSELLGKIAVEKNPCAVVVLEAQAREMWGSRDVSVVSGDMRRLQLANKADIIVSELLGKIAVEKNPCAVVVLEAQARELWGSRDVSVVSGDMRRLQLANKADIIVSELLGKIAVEKNPCAVVVLEAQARELWGSRDVSVVSGDMRRLQLANKADIIVSELLGKIAVEKNPCAVVVLEAQARELWGSRDVSVVSGDMRRLQLANKADIIVSELLGKIAVEKNPCAVVVLEAQARELWGSRDVSVVSGDMRRLQLANKADIIVSELLGKIAVEKNPCAVVVLEAQARELWGSRDVSVVSGDMRRLQLANKADIIVSELLGKIAVEKNPCAVVVLEAQARELWGSRDVSVVSGDMRRLQLANKADIIVSELLGKIAVEKNPCAVVVLEAQARELWGSRDVSVVSGDMRRLQLANKADIIVSELLGKIAVEKNPCAVVVLEAQARELWGSRDVSVVSGDMRRLQLANKADIIVSELLGKIAVEKNPCAVVVLEAQARELWGSRDVSVVSGDMRRLQLANKADIIVSELLGSWGDNELSPECLDGAAGLLKPRGVSIPHRYTSHVAPVSSPRLWAAAKAATAFSPHKNNLEMLWVVYMQNKHDIAETKPLFTFDHPAKPVRDHEGQELTDPAGLPVTDNRRHATISWTVQQDNVMHGFGGYFDCQLFGAEQLSIVPATHSNGMISWFPVFIPIKTPLRVRRGERVVARFWRCADAHRVWYEWLAEAGGRCTELHNSGGKSSEMLL